MNTVLAPLPLEGVGTPMVESLASYFLRLTLVHQVRPGQLTQVICNDSPFLHVGNGPMLKWRALYPAMLCSYSEQTAMIVRRLEKLTGEKNLTHGTLLRLKDNLCRKQTGGICERRRWCPKCYAEAASDHIMEPLAWSIPLVSFCPVHHVMLEEACTYCGAKQLDWHIGEARRQCNKCSHPLIASSSVEQSTPWQSWCQREMLKILEHIASCDTADFCAGAVTKFFAALPVRMPGAKTYRLSIGSFRHVVSKRPDALPRLNTLFQIAASWGTTPLEIMLRPLEAAAPSLFDRAVSMPAPQSKRRYHLRKYQQCERRLKALLELPEEILLPPAEHVRKEFQVSVNFQLRHRDVWYKYIEEKNRRLRHYKERKVLLANHYMEKHVAKLQCSGERLHRRNAIAQMMRDIGVPQNVARSAVRVCLLKLRMSRDGSV